MASSRGQVYYWVGCSAWRRLSRSNVLFFSSREEAVAAGYRPSASEGCAGPTRAPDLTAPRRVPSDAPIVEEICTVEMVVDGDTLDCADGRRIRLLLIDAPEMAQGLYGPVAKRALELLAPTGAVLRVEIDVDPTDQYGRTLAHLYNAAGESLNRTLLREGLAVVAVYPPNVRHVEDYRVAVEEARASRRGLWEYDAFECMPADFRAGRCN